jgi:hypothetical protein
LEIVTVEKRSFKTVEVTVEKPRSTLKWEFKTTENDIGFNLYRQRNIEELQGPNSGDDEDDVIPLRRVNSHLVPEDGMVVVQKPGKYVFKFDNTYSWYRTKRVMYKIEVIAPPEVKAIKSSGSRKETPEEEEDLK